MNLEKLKLLIKEGESLTVEFKEKFTPKIDRDLVAFANTKGGVIILGVKDDGKIIGEKLTNKLKAEILDIARNCDPEIVIKSIKQLDKVISIEVSEGEEKPYSSSSGFYRRLDAVTQKMTQKEVRLFFRETESYPFEALVCKDLSQKDIMLSKVKTFLKETGASVKVTKANLSMVLSSLGVMEKNKINYAGALMFASNIKKYVYHAESILGAFKGKNNTHIYDRNDVRDDLLIQFDQAITFLMKHLNIRSEIRGVQRYDIYEIPIDALREAVVNAIVHRDYSVRGTSIYVRVFDDRVEIENPGTLPSGVTVKNLGGSSFRRNPIIADLFHRMGKVERMGSGIKKMRSLMQEAGLKEPVFEAGFFFRATFYRDSKYSLKQGMDTVEKTVVNTVEKTVVKIIALIRDNPKITQRELMSVTGLTRRGIEWNLKKLKEDGIICRVGSARSGYWQVVK